MQTKLNVQYDYISLKFQFAAKDTWTFTVGRNGERASASFKTMKMDDNAINTAFNAFSKYMRKGGEYKARFENLQKLVEGLTTQEEVAAAIVGAI